MNKDIKNFFMGYFCVEEEQIEKLLSTETATDFLLIWSIFEAKCFEGRCTGDKIKKCDYRFKYKNLATTFYEKVEEFHKRYQNKTSWKNLYYKNENSYFKDIKNKKCEELDEIEKYKFGLYVIFRFRNNIFHGNKKIKSWLKYDPQIRNCISMMLDIMTDKGIKEIDIE
jgi:hypothetical protein